MQVGINARFLQYPATGSGQHLVHLLEALVRRQDGDMTYHLLGPGPRATLCDPSDIPPLVAQYQAQRPRSAPAERLQRLIWEQAGLTRAAREEGVDVLHAPYFSAPIMLPCPTVVTVHDVITLMLPEYREHLMNRLYTALIAHTVRQARLIIAVSECSKRDISQVLGIPPERIRVIGNAIDAEGYPSHDPNALAALRARLHLPDQYLLAGLGFDARKNLLRVIEGYAQLPAATRQAYPLVIAGRAHLLGHPLYPDPRPAIAALGVRDTVLLVGDVSEDEKPVLYGGATLFIWPSLYEGFGVPVLEAMACGAPVITSNTSSLPEVAGDAGLLIDPTDASAITRAITHLLADTDVRSDLSARGRERARQFSWDHVAEQTVQVYREALT